jgi:hypothetical protein
MLRCRTAIGPLRDPEVEVSGRYHCIRFFNETGIDSMSLNPGALRKTASSVLELDKRLHRQRSSDRWTCVRLARTC